MTYQYCVLNYALNMVPFRIQELVERLMTRFFYRLALKSAITSDGNLADKDYVKHDRKRKWNVCQFVFRVGLFLVMLIVEVLGGNFSLEHLRPSKPIRLLYRSQQKLGRSDFKRSQRNNNRITILSCNKLLSVSTEDKMRQKSLNCLSMARFFCRKIM